MQIIPTIKATIFLLSFSALSFCSQAEIVDTLHFENDCVLLKTSQNEILSEINVTSSRTSDEIHTPKKTVNASWWSIFGFANNAPSTPIEMQPMKCCNLPSNLGQIDTVESSEIIAPTILDEINNVIPALANAKRKAKKSQQAKKLDRINTKIQDLYNQYGDFQATSQNFYAAFDKATQNLIAYKILEEQNRNLICSLHEAALTEFEQMSPLMRSEFQLPLIASFDADKFERTVALSVEMFKRARITKLDNFNEKLSRFIKIEADK